MSTSYTSGTGSVPFAAVIHFGNSHDVANRLGGLFGGNGHLGPATLPSGSEA